MKLALGGAAINALLVSVTSGVLTTWAAAREEFRFMNIGSISGRDTGIVNDVWPFLLIGLSWCCRWREGWTRSRSARTS